MTIFQYLDQHGVQLDFQKPATLTGLKVDWSAPPPWKQADSAETETSYQILARADTPAGQYIPRALLIIAKLSVPVDAREAIKYGFVDVEQLDQFHRTNASLDDFDGNPSSFVSGTYPREGVELSTTTRYVIVTVPAGQYFVQLSTTIAASQQTQFGSEVDAINAGLRISPA